MLGKVRISLAYPCLCSLLAVSYECLMEFPVSLMHSTNSMIFALWLASKIIIDISFLRVVLPEDIKGFLIFNSERPGLTSTNQDTYNSDEEQSLIWVVTHV